MQLFATVVLIAGVKAGDVRSVCRRCDRVKTIFARGRWACQFIHSVLIRCRKRNRFDDGYLAKKVKTLRMFVKKLTDNKKLRMMQRLRFTVKTHLLNQSFNAQAYVYIFIKITV